MKAPGEERKKYAAFALAVLFVVAAIAGISLRYPRGLGARSTAATSDSNTITVSSSAPSNSSSEQPFLNASNIYASVGYPKVDYSPDYQEISDYSFNFGDPAYAPGEPSFNWEFPAAGDTYTAGTVEASVLSLDKAVDLAAAYAKLDPVNYTLAEAVFAAGTVYKSSPQSLPEWTLYFAEIHDGYWIYDENGPGTFAVEVAVDASNGTITQMEWAPPNISGLLPATDHYELSINASTALETVRASSPPAAPPGLIEDGSVISIAPRVVVNASVPGGSRLMWIIDLDRETGCCEQDGSFYVDAATGELVSESFSIGLGFPPQPGIGGSLALSTARNLTVSEQTFQANGSIVDRPGSATVAVPNVLVAKPGSTASILLNYSTYDLSGPLNVSLSFANPIPNFQNLSSSGSPPGVSLRFSSTSLVLPVNGSTSMALLVSVEGRAPSGTYLIQVDDTPNSGPETGLTNEVLLFFLSVWSGAGQWPPPPQWPVPEPVYTIEGYPQTYPSLGDAQNAATKIFPPGATYRVDLNGQDVGTFQVPR